MPKIVEDEVEKKDLLSEMVRFQSALGVSAVRWVETFVELLIDLPTAWYLINVALKDEFADSWIKMHGEWDHSGGRTQAHNRLGMAYAWWVSYEANGLDEIRLADSPDFTGYRPLINSNHKSPATVRVCGDIGKCTPVALYDSVKALNFHDIWISVLDWETQVFIEFGYSPAQYNLLKIGARLWRVRDTQERLKAIFFCEGCNQWSITEDSRQKLIDWFQSRQ